MSYIGNDILSRRDRDNLRSFSDPKYLKKVFTDRELQLLHNEESEILPFVFWTCKESAYKIAVKNGYNLAFVPQYFEVVDQKIQMDDDGSVLTGSITFEKKLFHFRSNITADFVSTIASEQENDLPFVIDYAHYYTESDMSLQLKASLRKEVSKHFNADPEDFYVGKNTKGVPYISADLNAIMPDISCSHDGPYYAFALLYSRS